MAKQRKWRCSLNEVSFDWPSGATLDFYRFQLNGDVFKTAGPAAEVWGVGGAGDYEVVMTENGAGGHYVCDFDGSSSITDGVYPGVIKLRAGANPADSDIQIGRGIMYWASGAELNQFTLNTQIDDEVIGADGDTHEDLSDQMDNLSSQKSQVLNEYDDRT